MSKSRLRIFTFILTVFVLFNSACAQDPSSKGKTYVKEEKQAEESTVLLNNASFLIPLQNLDQLKIASVHFSCQYTSGFDSLLNKYSKVALFNGNDYSGIKNLDNLTADLKWYNTIIIQLDEADLSNPLIVNFINSNQKFKSVIVALFGSSNALIGLNNVSAPIIWCDKVTPVSAFYSAQAIFGGVAITHKLTKDFSTVFRKNMGFTTTKVRLQYTVPEDAGVNSNNLLAIDDIANEAISGHATPGCVVLVAKDGKVIYNKAYGYHTYDKTIPDKLTDIFDLASMTKISATTMETMQLTDQGKLNLDATIGDYIPMAQKTNKNDLRVREILEHQAGLIPDIPTFEKIRPIDHSPDSSATYPTKVNTGYFLRKDYFKDVLWPAMLNSPLRIRGQYVYSDLSMCFMQQIVETITSVPLNVYVQQQFFTPMGMQTAGFLPLYRFAPSQIIPTEDDEVYRHDLLDGYVDDPTSALMGGVAGHAGLFASANDVAILYQMMLNRGSYGGVQYIKPETVDLFTDKQSDVSRRGLGFDRWDPIAANKYPSELASPQTYGHTGYTGTCVWVDPTLGLVYIFLSNRVNPKVTGKLSSLNIRPRIQDVIVTAIRKGL
jgi:CubicO group peptidase (beta-lactamase class C family)